MCSTLADTKMTYYIFTLTWLIINVVSIQNYYKITILHQDVVIIGGNEGSQKGYLFPDFSVRSEEIVNCRGGGQVNSSSWSYLIIFHQFQLWSERSYIHERTIVVFDRISEQKV